MSGNLFVVSGCSGVGKGTLIKEFLKRNPDIVLSISYTTRSPRFDEKDGVNYFFIDRTKFQSLIDNNELIEYAEFSGNLYGTGRSYIEKKLNEGSDVLLEIDVQGCKQVKKMFPKASSIFILPPSIDELEHRLRGRNTESEDAINKRLAAANCELLESKNFDYRVVNDNIEKALADMQNIFLSARKD